MKDSTAARVEALESLLVEKGIVDSSVVDKVVDHYETNVGPLNGAKVIARAWADPGYLQRLLSDGTRAIAELGFGGAEGHMIVAVPNTPAVHNVVVCTLCSCYPWPVLGLPPSWYKSSAYRSRMVAQPRALLAEMGLELPADILVRGLGQLGGGALFGRPRAAGRDRWPRRGGAGASRHARLDDRGGATTLPHRRR